MNQVEILRQLQKFPQKKFGQNFLIDEEVLHDIVEAASLTETDTVVEVGPGLGALTFELLAKAQRVIAIEADVELATHLREKNISKLTVVTSNALEVDWTVTIVADYKIVANIPYSITSPLLTKIFRQTKKPACVVLLIQKEVAERLLAEAGNNDRGLLTLRREANANIELIRLVKPESFYPAPTVESAVVRITPYSASKEEEIFWPAVEGAFARKRQMIGNGLAKGLQLPRDTVNELLQRINIEPTWRPAELSFEQWVQLSAELKKEF